MKAKLSCMAVLVAVLAASLFAYAYSAINASQNVTAPQSGAIVITHFKPFFQGDNISGCNLTVANTSDKNFTEFKLTAVVDDSAIEIANVYSYRPVYAHDSGNRTVLIDWPENFTSISANQTINVKLTLVKQISQFSEHTITFHLLGENNGDLLNNQTFVIPQRKAYLQIVGYSPVQHDTDTWHLQYNSSKQQYEYVNDSPNYYQKTHKFFNLPESVFNWSRALDHIGENYYNVTVLNNNTFPVEAIQFYGGATIDAQSPITGSPVLLLPNQTCVIPVGGRAVPAFGGASGEIKSK